MICLQTKIRRIFVYGTLDKIPLFSELLKTEEIKYVGRGKIKARLYDLGEYPGAVEDRENRVYGKVYEISGMDKVLPQFDEYEGFYPDKPEKSLYVRKVKKVEMDDGRILKAYVYIYNRSVKGLKEIESGVWEKQFKA